MPGSYLIDMPRSIVFSRGWGVLTDEEILSHAATLRADRRFDPGFRQVADFRDLSEIRVTSAGVRDVARLNPFNRDSRRAFVVSTDEAFGLVRMFGSFTDSLPDQFKIFRALAPAMDWVGVDPTTPWPAREPDATFRTP